MDHPHTQNPERTAEYLARMAARGAELRQQLQQILTTPQDFTWEVGCGHGHFLTAYAQAHPDQICIGIDLAAERIARAERKRTRASLPNLFFIQAEATLFVDVIPAHARISRLFVLFPDPWPKSRHHKHRVMQTGFLTQAAARAADTCELYFRTDYRPYFEDTNALIQSHPAWQHAATPWPFEYETVFQTRAAEIHSLIARRIATVTPS
ncbi:tRNA (guanosine(46)-N7)-methyltransferase TrmB [Horticoccus sp. 23ND18S-11]|uniref:tRNA (guanosine(46)-N7)-methyltransferase TrmB n=1 Tax=Horticoccus sp. 23ND18S-11 TaxID=3391832 RepID=UPI0039C93104